MLPTDPASMKMLLLLALAAVALGAADYFNYPLAGFLPWQRSTVYPNLTPIRYCYANKDIYDFAHGRFEQAITMWNRDLGRRSPENGHSLLFQAAQYPNGTRKYCYPKFPNLEWNEDIQEVTLAILDRVPGAVHRADGASATAGGWLRDPRSFFHGRNRIVVGMQATALMLRHEVRTSSRIILVGYSPNPQIGHVLGLVHEHQRFDRKSHR